MDVAPLIMDKLISLLIKSNYATIVIEVISKTKGKMSQLKDGLLDCILVSEYYNLTISVQAQDTASIATTKSIGIS